MKRGETNSKCFFALEKTRAKNKAINKLIVQEDKIVTKQKDILKEQKNFYESLYKSNLNIKFEMKREPPHKVNEEMKVTLDSELTLEEVSEALVQTKRFKTPGPDGIPCDFYKMFYGKLKDLMLDAFKYAFQARKIHQSSREGIISLIPKPNRDNRYLKNWRLIILLCADYKLLAKAISNRIRGQLKDLIDKDQSAFVQGRDIANNIWKIDDVIHLCYKHKIEGLLLSIDFEKAFDRVEYSSILKTLEYFGFGLQLIRWTQLLYTDFSLRTINNGYASENFFPTRGLFQGNPYSPFGFVLIIELLAITIRQNKDIRGINIKGMEFLLSMFADDIDILIPKDVKVWQQLQYTFKEFENLSGLKVNYDKTSVYRLGSLRSSRALDYALRKLQWSEGKINILGIDISID